MCILCEDMYVNLHGGLTNVAYILHIFSIHASLAINIDSVTLVTLHITVILADTVIENRMPI